MNPWPHGPERRKTLEKAIKIGKRHNFDTKFLKFFHILPRYRYAFFNTAFARRNFYEDTRLDITSAARFLLKKKYRCTRTGFSFLFGFCCRPGDVAVGDSGAGAWNKGFFWSEATPFRASARISTCALLTMGNVVTSFFLLYHNLNLMVVEFCLLFWKFCLVG